MRMEIDAAPQAEIAENKAASSDCLLSAEAASVKKETAAIKCFHHGTQSMSRRVNLLRRRCTLAAFVAENMQVDHAQIESGYPSRCKWPECIIRSAKHCRLEQPKVSI
ncbi:hypothetical protein COCOBI_04-5490 [Coccomyxa sp. Obi]|nr:hypothetical protein COCOBI_04-5490 [Coccomyxa sp. Obi]